MPATYESLVTEVRAALRGYGLVREQATFLNGSLTSSALTFNVDDGTLVSRGPVEIDTEILDVQSVAGNAVTLAPDGRGFDGTTAAAHADNARVKVAPAYPVWRLARAINDAITGVYPTLYAVSSTTFTFTLSQVAYTVPADCENVLQVTTTDPFGVTPEIHRYKFDSANQTITLMEFPAPGQTVTVVYQKAPVEIAAGQNFTVSGLAETARSCIVYGAVARLLSFVDPTRVTTDSASAEGWADVQRAGSASQVAAQLTARYQMELETEAARLRKAYPPRLRWTGR